METTLRIAGAVLFLYSVACTISAVLHARRREASPSDGESRKPFLARHSGRHTVGAFAFALAVTGAGYFTLATLVLGVKLAGMMAAALAWGTAALFLQELSRYRKASADCADMAGVVQSNRHEIFRLRCENMGLRGELREQRSRIAMMTAERRAPQPASPDPKPASTEPRPGYLPRTEAPPLPRKREYVPPPRVRKATLSDEELNRRIGGLWDKRPAKA